MAPLPWTTLPVTILLLVRTNCRFHVPSGSDHLVGWVPQSSGRGTFTLLWTFSVTTILCSWMVIHPRIDKRRKFCLGHKSVISLNTVIAPELIAVEGAQEWTQARKVVKRCEQVTSGQLSLVQAFYVGMLGIRYRTPLGTRVLWPNQFIWLLEQGLFRWEDHANWRLRQQDIIGRSNADGAEKLFALAQVG